MSDELSPERRARALEWVDNLRALDPAYELGETLATIAAALAPVEQQKAVTLPAAPAGATPRQEPTR